MHGYRVGRSGRGKPLCVDGAREHGCGSLRCRHERMLRRLVLRGSSAPRQLCRRCSSDHRHPLPLGGLCRCGFGAAAAALALTLEPCSAVQQQGLAAVLLLCDRRCGACVCRLCRGSAARRLRAFLAGCTARDALRFYRQPYFVQHRTKKGVLLGSWQAITSV